jgi:hypothetical protein
MDRDWWDVVLIALIVLFMYLKAWLLDRDTRLGKAMAAYNIVLGTVFLLSLLRGVVPLFASPLYLSAQRVVIILVVLWSVAELAQAKWHFVRGRRRGVI